MKTQASIMPGIYKRARYSRKEGAKMIQDIAPHKLNNQYGQKKHRMQAANFYIMMAERFW